MGMFPTGIIVCQFEFVIGHGMSLARSASIAQNQHRRLTFVHTYVIHTRMKDLIAGFDWDDGNKSKCQKHGVTIEEIEALFLKTDPIIGDDVRHSEEEDRFLLSVARLDSV